MKEFPVSETAMIRTQSNGSSDFVRHCTKQLEDSSDPFPVAEFIFADLFTALCSAFS